MQHSIDRMLVTKLDTNTQQHISWDTSKSEIRQKKGALLKSLVIPSALSLVTVVIPFLSQHTE